MVRIPSRYLPVLIFLFYTLLVPGSSLILHIAVVATTYLCKFLSKKKHVIGKKYID